MLLENILISVIRCTCYLNVHLAVSEVFGCAECIYNIIKWLSVFLLLD